MARMAEWTKSLKTGRPGPPPDAADASLFGPLAFEVSGLARRLYRAEQAAEQEAALRLRGETVWTEERLKQFVNLQVGGPIFVVSNREPVSHVSKDGKIVAQTPASGLVTAMEPVLRACGGRLGGPRQRRTPTARSSDERGPPRRAPWTIPRYTLRRVWLTPEEEYGYYYSFSNEGLWPLCHIVHTRPLFRPEDWEQYKAVNRKFALALIDEMDGVEAPLVLIQDYHFALLPLLREGGAAGRPGGDLLAHPVAQLRGLRHLPVAARDPAGHARRRPDRLPHPVPLQQLPGDGGAGHRVPGWTGSTSRSPAGSG